jgi:hypothetical protein
MRIMYSSVVVIEQVKLVSWLPVMIVMSGPMPINGYEELTDSRCRINRVRTFIGTNPGIITVLDAPCIMDVSGV